MNMSSSNKKGKYIVIDGGEGSGKDTQINFLKERFFGEKYYFTREPGGSDIAELIRTFMLKTDEGKNMSAASQFACAWASRVHHLETVVKPKLQAGIHIISNRADSSTFAYQLHGQKALELESAFWEIRKAVFADFLPDLYIWLHVDATTSLKRVAVRGVAENHFDAKESDFHQRVRKGFEEFFGQYGLPCSEIDGSKTKEEVREDILKILTPLIGS
jgi:dTMP kinase